MTPADGTDSSDDVPERPDTDDYDLLTFGEVAARLSEELAQRTAELDQARSEPDPDPGRIQHLEERISLLRTSRDRYRQEQQTNESFMRRFGPISGSQAGPRPRWQ